MGGQGVYPIVRFFKDRIITLTIIRTLTRDFNLYVHVRRARMNDLHSIQSMNTSQSSMRTDRVFIATFHCVIKQFQDTVINQEMWDLGQILGLPWHW